MPNILEMLTAQRNPQVAGLLGQVASGAPAQPQQRQGFLGRLGNIISGSPNPNLSPEEQAQVRRDSFVDAGLNTIIASSDPNRVPGALEALATGIKEGRETARQSATDLIVQRGEAQRQRLAEIKSGQELAAIKRQKDLHSLILQGDTTSVEGRRQILNGAIQLGMVDEVQNLSSLFSDWNNMDATEQAEASRGLLYDTVDQNTHDPLALYQGALSAQAQGLEGDAVQLRLLGDSMAQYQQDNPDEEILTVNNQLVARNTNTNEVTVLSDLSENAAVRASRIQTQNNENRRRAEGAGEFVLQQMDKVSSDFRSAMGGFSSVANSLQTARNAPHNGTGEGTLIFALQNVRDQGRSTVREGEVKSVEAANSLLGRVEVMLNKLDSVDVLSDEQDRQVRAEIERLGQEAAVIFENDVIEPFMARVDRANEQIVERGERPIQYYEVMSNPFNPEDDRFTRPDPRLQNTRAIGR